MSLLTPADFVLDVTPYAIATREWERRVASIRGTGSNLQVEKYHSVTRGGEEPDHIPWCASFVWYCLVCAGYAVEGQGTKRARDLMAYGRPVMNPYDWKPGDIGVFSRGGVGSGKGHVTFINRLDKRIPLLVWGRGGNQNAAVCDRAYLRGRLLGVRRPSRIVA